MKIFMECNTCFGVSWTVDSMRQDRVWMAQAQAHIKSSPGHLLRARMVTSPVPDSRSLDDIWGAITQLSERLNALES